MCTQARARQKFYPILSSDLKSFWMRGSYALCISKFIYSSFGRQKVTYSRYSSLLVNFYLYFKLILLHRLLHPLPWSEKLPFMYISKKIEDIKLFLYTSTIKWNYENSLPLRATSKKVVFLGGKYHKWGGF